MTENRLTVMKEPSTLSLIFISVFCSITLGSSDFHLITLSKTYEEAKSYCREMYSDLATVYNSTDMNKLIALVSTTTPRAWIGLEIGAVRMWHWSWPDQNTDFFNWKAGEPQENNQDACAAMDEQGRWFESDCGTRRSFVCHGNGNTSGHIFVAETKSWRNAQNHCRGLTSDLVSIHSAEENKAVRNVSASQNVWIGLFKDPWKWSDGSNSSFRFWRPNQPNYREGQECVAAIFRNGGQWNDRQCNGKLNFVCRGARRSIPTTTNQQTTQETITTNLTTPTPNNSSEDVIVTFNFTVAPTTEQVNTTNVTTTPATTASGLTTPNATSSTELNNATTEMSNVTATQIPPTTNVTTDSVSPLATLNVTSAQNSTPSSTLMPTSQSLHSENLILIQENLTWIEAVSYCREHHIDLVHITTKDIQDKVAEKARNATTPHVWLGLRYTCSFKFWFWTRSTSGCYQNWVPGQGSEGEYECGVSGAIEATGRQQWVGLPETEKLNFICYACAG